MIKIAIVSLGRNIYCGFSLNQEYPVASIVHSNASRDVIEHTFISRFHSQRFEYRKNGADIDYINSNGKRRGGWKFIWCDTSIFWNKTEKTTKQETQTLVNETGLRIEKLTPLTEIAKATAEEIENEPMYVAKRLGGGFEFTPVTDDIVPESKIGEYMKTHRD